MILYRNISSSVLLFFIFYFLFSPVRAQEVPMDYSYCGYHRSEKPIPSANVAVYVEPVAGDNSAMIQGAIDYLSMQKPDRQTGLRGAILLAEGTYELSEPLRIRTSGVVLRGSGRDKTILRKKGYDRGALLYIEGTHDIITKDTFTVSDAQAGAISVTVQGAFAALKHGQRLAICRPSTQEWIDALGCASFGGGKRMGYWAWHPGDIDLRWNRRILAVNGKDITLDAPITCNIDARWGGA
nr:glycoside hydrolase family 55 protein [Prevotella sp.]